MEIVDQELANFLVSGRLIGVDTVSWSDATRFDLACYICSRLPPLQYVSSVRAIVFRDDTVLVVRGEKGQFYILPGGRREQDESLEETLRREVLEETGWTLKEISILGYMHFHHLSPKKAGYPYPYPDFLWPIYIATADNYILEAIAADKYVTGVRFYTIGEIPGLGFEKGELVFLDDAVKLRQSQI